MRSRQRGDKKAKLTMIRFLCLNTFIAIHTILFCAWGVLLGLFDKTGRWMHLYAAIPWAKSILWVCGIKVRVTGLQNVESDEPRIYMSNHQSYFDIFALLAYLPVAFKFIMKRELMRIPILGFAMRRVGYIGIDRDNPRNAVKSMNQAADKIRRGISMVMFPEGTRSTDGSIQEFKRGGFNLALKSGADVVPVAIRDSHRIVPKGSLRIRKGSFEMCIGRPISLRGYRKKDMGLLMEEVKKAMEDMICQPEACQTPLSRNEVPKRTPGG